MMSYRKRSTAALLVLGSLVLAACDSRTSDATGSAASADSPPAKPLLSKGDLCRSLLSGQHVDTQSLLDLTYEINPTHSEPYSGADSDCYRVATHELELSK
jgi:hypothetical protein